MNLSRQYRGRGSLLLGHVALYAFLDEGYAALEDDGVLTVRVRVVRVRVTVAVDGVPGLGVGVVAAEVDGVAAVLLLHLDEAAVVLLLAEDLVQGTVQRDQFHFTAEVLLQLCR